MTAEAVRGRSVVMTVAADGSMTVTVDGRALACNDGGWTRESFAAVLDRATDHHQELAVVEVRETDGSVFTDRIPAAGRRGGRAAEHVVEVAATGFLPGEQVVLAVLRHHVTAGHDGTVHARVPAWAADCSGGVLLLGRASGTFHVVATS